MDGASPAGWSLAGEMALCGDIARTLALMKTCRLRRRPASLSHVADAAMQQEAAGRAALPPPLQADLIALSGFPASGGRPGRGGPETLQGIGLRSPFLEWKLLLHGLQAYWQNDNDRARGELAAADAGALAGAVVGTLPFPHRCRFSLCPAAGHASHAAKTDRPSSRFDAVDAIAQLASDAGPQDKMAAACGKSRQCCRHCGRSAASSPRLAACFYWAILESGPDEILRYQRDSASRRTIRI